MSERREERCYEKIKKPRNLITRVGLGGTLGNPNQDVNVKVALTCRPFGLLVLERHSQLGRENWHKHIGHLAVGVNDLTVTVDYVLRN